MHVTERVTKRRYGAGHEWRRARGGARPAAGPAAADAGAAEHGGADEGAAEGAEADLPFVYTKFSINRRRLKSASRGFNPLSEIRLDRLFQEWLESRF